ncbi:hypothetical protein LOC68_18665 [Blastopirellula sp. JC732]|uniref:Uncharacterized protein n=1 Tax=Blastopirellula sediminis TaxID=2894196 RepID=A0A9X1MQ61_9BACT|nr:hypothetical protein [Blastopirellula sediminis]MCC9606280.1 hypothetical protein [Blastopirellula sediminis]MCC9630422.1 hypothetical protein [Blastopirellula sediminis]
MRKKKSKTIDRAAKNVGAGKSVEQAKPDVGTPGAAAKPEVQSNSVEYVNIGLMLLALAIAAVVPFELFLISYAVLGPLHYLTEISWLHDRKYFTPRKADWALLVGCGLLATLGNGNVLGEQGVAWLDQISIGSSTLYQILNSHYADVLFFALGMAVVFVVARQTSLRLFGLAVVLVCAFFFNVNTASPAASAYYKLFGVYLPTLIHVFVFTGAFIFAGALKRNSKAGFLSFAVFLGCGAAAIWLPNLAGAPPTEAPAVFWRGFQELSLNSLNDLLRLPTEAIVGTNLFTGDVVLRLVRFLAFAYTYHYLNWFSKTQIIGWHEVPKTRLAVIVIAWLASMGLYAVNYDLGLRWLFLLSLTHVLLEFPLNFQCFKDIGISLRRRLAPA